MFLNRKSFLAGLKTAALAVLTGAILFLILIPAVSALSGNWRSPLGSIPTAGDGDFIHWVDFDVPQEALERAFRLDVNTCQSEIHIGWVDLLA